MVENQHPKENGCDFLAEAFTNKIFYVGSLLYTYENQEFWSNTEILSPKCAQDVAEGIHLLKARGKFDVRGGWHMGIEVL